MLTNDPNLSAAAIRAADAAQAVRLSPISLFEISQKVRAGKWPEMAPYLDTLPDLAAGQGILTAPLTAEIAITAGRLSWSHRDPFDRILAATALQSGAVLVSADAMFDTLPSGGLQRIW